MPFISERIPEADKSKIDIDKIRASRMYYSEPRVWIVDRDKDIYLLPLGGGGPEKPSAYGLFVQGELVTFRADIWGTGNNKVGIDLSYKISFLSIPQSIENSRDEIKKMIRESLDAYGSYGDRTHVNTISVEFV